MTRMPPEDFLLVALCDGPRCAALRRLACGAGEEESDLCVPLRDAIRAQPHGVLMTVACLGPCARGSVAAVGRAVAVSEDRLDWTRRPVAVGRVDDPLRMEILADWIRRADRPSSLPPELRSEEIA